MQGNNDTQHRVCVLQRNLGARDTTAADAWHLYNNTLCTTMQRNLVEGKQTGRKPHDLYMHVLTRRRTQLGSRRAGSHMTYTCMCLLGAERNW